TKAFAAAAVAAALLLGAAGCDTGGGTGKKPEAGKNDDHHDHPTEGPHGGALAEWGEEEYHVEVTFDHDSNTVNAYVLGPDAKKPTPIEAEKLTLTLKSESPVTIDLTPKPEESDPPGMSSRFTGTHEALAKKHEFKGTVSGVVNGKPFAGDFAADEDHHGHKH
ncbi:MAG TPA: hypothetical protein VIL46_18870, partial [Gemmataceae bacterium]